MGARIWVFGVVGAGIAVALGTFAGCGSSSSGGAKDAGDDSAVDAPCTPEDASFPDSGACGACIQSTCATQLMACSQDCTCGMTINTVATCLQTTPPPALGGLGNIAALLGTDAGNQLVAFAMCAGTGAGGLTGGLGGGLAGGLGGGGSAGGGAAGGAMSSAAGNYVSCLLTSCATACGPGDGGVDGGTETGAGDGGTESSTGDSGSGDAGSAETGSPETGTTDATSDGSSSDGGTAEGGTGDASDGSAD
jgi:hypothetical protein